MVPEVRVPATSQQRSTLVVSSWQFRRFDAWKRQQITEHNIVPWSASGTRHTLT
jgi:hypothetical protein